MSAKRLFRVDTPKPKTSGQKYFINMVRFLESVKNIGSLQIDRRKDYVGLFTATNWKGEGTFCGWYGTEYYQDTMLLGVYEIEHCSPVDFKKRISNPVSCKIHFDEIAIGSGMWEHILYAKSDEEAFHDFGLGWFGRERS